MTDRKPEPCDSCMRSYFCRAFLGESYRADGPCDWEPSRYSPGVGPCSDDPDCPENEVPGPSCPSVIEKASMSPADWAKEWRDGMECWKQRAEQAEARVKELVAPTKPIWETVAEMGAAIPAEAWDKVPRDGARNLDHYLYGSPKQEEPVPSALDEVRAACTSLWRQTNEVWRKYEASEKKCGALEAEINRLRGGKGDGDVDR